MPVATRHSLLPMMPPPFVPLKSLTVPSSSTIDAIQNALTVLAGRNPQLAAGVVARCEGLHPLDPRYIICMSTALTIARGIEQTQAEKAARAAAMQAQEASSKKKIDDVLTMRRNTFGVAVKVKPGDQATSKRREPEGVIPQTVEERFNKLELNHSRMCRDHPELWYCREQYRNECQGVVARGDYATESECTKRKAIASRERVERATDVTVTAKRAERFPQPVASRPLSFIDLYKPRYS